LDLDAIESTGNASAFQVGLGTFTGLQQGNFVGFNPSFTPESIGQFSATYTLHLSDEDLPGQQMQSLTLSLVGKAILAGDYMSERRSMLAAKLAGRPDADALFAVNDVVIQKGETGRMLDFTTVVDGVYVNTHRGDGLIVATPTGSTAYALSCGGPIIQPNVNALVMVPICPHTLSDRPLVLPSTSTVRVSLEPDTHGPAHVVCDGEALAKLGAGETVTISLATQTVTLLHPRDYNYYELLRSKLNWGRANRDRPATRG